MQANQFLASLFRDNGMHVVSLHEFSAWKEYVDDTITEPQLKERAQVEMDEVSRTFGKYLAIAEDEPTSFHYNDVKVERARLANRIYRKICQDAGLTACFFNDFKTWSEYVSGVIGEAEFYERAREEAARIIANKKAQSDHKEL